LAINLLQNGWVPNALIARGSFYKDGDTKEFWVSKKISAPRSYYLCLAQALDVFNIFGDDFSIVHRMTDHYYLSILRIQSRARALEFRLLLDTKPLLTLTDQDYKDFVDDAITPVLMDILLPITFSDDVVVVADLKASSIVKDEASRQTAMEVLCGVQPPNSPEPIKFDTLPIEYFLGMAEYEEDESIPIKLYFDNKTCTHSGSRRVFAVCPNKAHPACFRYVYLKDFSSVRACAINLAAWSVIGMVPGMQSPITMPHFFITPHF
jgi:hypothetical protein